MVCGMHGTTTRSGAADGTTPLAYSVPAAGKLIGLSTRQAWRLVGSGALKSYMDGGRRLVSRRALEEYVAAREEEAA